jgi:hypothetical protein
MSQWSENTKELLAAIFEVQANVGPVKKNATNPHYKSHYATLDSVWATLAPHLAEQGLVVAQTGSHNVHGATLITECRHVDTGQFVRSELPLYGGKTDPQGVGSAMTYARRYALCAMFGLMLADDDGNAASSPPKQHQRPTQSNPAPRATQNTNPAPNRAQNERGGVNPDFARSVITSLKTKPPTRMVVGEMTVQQAEDAKGLAIWRLDKAKTGGGKYAAKNLEEAQGDIDCLEAYLLAMEGGDYATSLPAGDNETEPPFAKDAV